MQETPKVDLGEAFKVNIEHMVRKQSEIINENQYQKQMLTNQMF